MSRRSSIARFRPRSVSAVALAIISVTPVAAAPRMISYGYPSCVSCHFAVQGRGPLNSYGRGIDMAQSYSKKDFTAMLLGRPTGGEDPSANWDGRIRNVLADFIATLRRNERLDLDKTDPSFAAVYRQIIFFGQDDRFRVSTDVGFVDGGLHEVQLAPGFAATGGEVAFVRKMLFEWRLATDGSSGQEIAFGRDYLPLGLQIDDYSTFLLHLNAAGIYDTPLQLKYFAWTEKSLVSAYAFGPSFDDASDRDEYGGGLLYERYPNNKLAIGVQALAGWSDASDRLRVGPYVRWGISPKWALLSGVDYSAHWDVGSAGERGRQVTGFAQVFYHHTEWLVSSVTANYAYSDFLQAKEHLASFRYTTAARLNRNFTIGVSFVHGDIQRNLGYGHELAFFTNIKF